MEQLTYEQLRALPPSEHLRLAAKHMNLAGIHHCQVAKHIICLNDAWSYNQVGVVQTECQKLEEHFEELQTKK